MRVIIGGCGRVGSALAGSLDRAGHAVTIIDVAERAFDRLDDGFGGTRVQGIAFDRATLLRSGIEDADAFVAVTNGDNTNVVSARTARDRFGVPTVVARIYDPQRASIYERHGITTIASARWTTDAILSHLAPGDTRLAAAIGPGEGDVVVIDHDLPDGGPWEVEAFDRQGRWLLAAVTKTGQTTIPVPRQLLQAGERIHLAVQRAAWEEARAFLDRLGEEASSA